MPSTAERTLPSPGRRGGPDAARARRRRLAGVRSALWLVVALGALQGCGRAPLNVLIVIFDTTRADALGAYGNAAASTPVIDRLAREGVLFEQAYTAVPITSPAHSTLMTGKLPFSHGVRDNSLFTLPESQVTLAELLRQHGYRTAAAVGAFPLSSRFGHSQGFDFFDDDFEEAEHRGALESVVRDNLFFAERRAAAVNRAVLPWLEENAADPFFLWVHYFDPHQPYEPPHPYDKLFRHQPYAGEIAYSDENLGTLIGHLQRLGVWERTLMVFAADHGEGLGEHQEATHSLLAYDSTLRVPLIVKAPGGARDRRVRTRVATVDVVPTILDWLGLEVPAGLQGRSLKSQLRPDRPASLRQLPIYAETLSPRLTHGWAEQRTLIVGDMKYLHGAEPELYDLAADPRELKDLAGERPGQADRMRRDLQTFLDRYETAAASTAELDPETLQLLASLGYLQTAGGRVGAIDETLRAGGVPPQRHIREVSAMSHARAALALGRPWETRRICERAMAASSDPVNPIFSELIAVAEFQLDRPAEGLRHLRGVLAPQTPPAVRTRIYGYLERLELSSSQVREVGARVAEAESDSPTAQGPYLLARLHHRAGRLPEELESLRTALRLDPALLPARLSLATALARRGRRGESLQHLEAVLAEDPYMPEAHYNLGVFFFEAGRLDDARRRLERALALRPSYAEARFALILMLAELDRELPARDHLATLKSDPAARDYWTRAERTVEERWPTQAG